MSTQVSINLNAIAMIRNRRNLPWPNLVDIGRISLLSGASGLTIHPRPDQRHIRFTDISKLRRLIDEEFPKAELNIEGYPSEKFLSLCELYKPEQVTLVPDEPDQLTSDHGWNFIENKKLLTESVSRLQSLGSRVSLFTDSEGKEEPIKAAKQTGADCIELYTGPYGACYNDPNQAIIQLEKLYITAYIAKEMHFKINAGHDLTIQNIPNLIHKIDYISEISIGHAFTATAIEHGTRKAVLLFRRACGHF
ncbi:pyridoxine 5'-phosphate synthase [Candidatus Liberibacter americanus]|uniref:Pyridoxine 5'-phosphate synthase n=1 Tax=Candidatus Liberibacter americanus str. Sao Paulo TaxID=1261131 RepID=U6B3F3_9HYPH|nr:pyridoxine 5'-phosphate synthase [Candidatus Liberibacter americanus]AHA27450.1 Pyridoxal phosphate biosynthesis protein [Candidatus Liberibacter americanus str. Sao Paulo]EMS36723.1 pyridoxine 5'-phosphate synthase [Candidatus Liberibacter americanus PW_SP]